VTPSLRVCLKNAVASAVGSPSGKSPSFAFNRPGLGLSPSGRAEKGRYRPEKRDFRGGEVPFTSPPVELVVEGDPSDVLPVNFQTRSHTNTEHKDRHKSIPTILTECPSAGQNAAGQSQALPRQIIPAITRSSARQRARVPDLLRDLACELGEVLMEHAGELSRLPIVRLRIGPGIPHAQHLVRDARAGGGHL